MLLEFADAMDLAIGNTWFTKDEGRLVTYESGGCRTVVDYILVRRNERSLLSNITVLQGESSLQQHKLLVGMLVMNHHHRLNVRFSMLARVGRFPLMSPLHFALSCAHSVFRPSNFMSPLTHSPHVFLDLP